jgi:hypothetical protein
VIPDELRDLVAFTRAEFETEWRSDFARLRRIPSTNILRFLDYFADQPPQEQAALADDLALNALGLLTFYRQPDLHAYLAGREAYRRYVSSLQQYWGYRYFGTRLLRSLLADEKTDPRLQLPPEVRAQAAAIVPTNSREIRKGIKARFKKHFGAQPEKLGGGDWQYVGQHGDVALQVWIDTGGMTDQLRYWVTVHDPARGIRLRNLSLEAMCGQPMQTGWDNVEARNLDAALDLLVELAIYCAGIPARLPDGFESVIQ